MFLMSSSHVSYWDSTGLGIGVVFLSLVCCSLGMVVLGFFTQNTESSIYLKMDGWSLFALS